MSEPLDFGFGKLVPGFDFLQTLAKGAAQAAPQVPNMGTWVSPTLDTEELDKRVGELRTVQFWLEQNANAIKATIQALEVQKMTLSALKGMNVSVGDMAEAFKIKTTEFTEPATSTAADNSESPAASTPPVVDPMQWWGALTDQFQQIASTAMKDVSAVATKASTPAPTQSKEKKPPVKNAAAKKAVAKKAVAKKAAGDKPARKTAARTARR